MQQLPRELWRTVELYLTPARLHVSCAQSYSTAYGRVTFLDVNGVCVYTDDRCDPLRFDFGFNETRVAVFGPSGLQAEATFSVKWKFTFIDPEHEIGTRVGDVLVIQRSPLTQALHCEERE